MGARAGTVLGPLRARRLPGFQVGAIAAGG